MGEMKNGRSEVIPVLYDKGDPGATLVLIDYFCAITVIISHLENYLEISDKTSSVCSKAKSSVTPWLLTALVVMTPTY
ncbi:hypothetical protein ACNKHP_22640 [Shigella boydii]